MRICEKPEGYVGDTERDNAIPIRTAVDSMQCEVARFGSENILGMYRYTLSVRVQMDEC